MFVSNIDIVEDLQLRMNRYSVLFFCSELSAYKTEVYIHQCGIIIYI